jgi:hypothetical protein
MKRAALLFWLLLVPALFAAAQDTRPRRTAELGFDLDLGYANGFLALGDIFNARRALTFDFSRTTVDDFAFHAFADAEAFITVNVKGMSFSLFAGAEASGQAKAENLLLFFREGNSRLRDFSGSGKTGGGAFLDAGLRASFRVKNFRISVAPALFMPLFYMPPPEINYRTRTDGDTGKISLDINAGADLYSAVPLEGGGLSPGQLKNVSLPLGADLSVELLWLFRPWLDLGAGISHIPVVPATLKYRTGLRADYSWQAEDLFQELSGGTFSIPGLPQIEQSRSESSFTVLRPLRLDFFALYRPVAETDLFVIRPAIGLSFLTAYGYGQVCFNIALEGQVNILRGFSLKLSTGLDEWVWQHRLALAFNVHAVELRLAASLRGTDFAGSWTGRGLGLSLGMSFGW